MTHRIVKPSIDECFIHEVPRFFGGWLATLREVFPERLSRQRDRSAGRRSTRPKRS